MSYTHAAPRPMRWPGFCYAAMAVLACAFAFVGLSASSFWIDELFTIHVIHHQGGLDEVFRRALTDVHPPLYYFFLYGWSRLFGFSEWSLRLPSAILAVLAIALFAHAAKRVSRATAVAFACAAATVSTFWFDQSQNARSYMLALLWASALLHAAMALHRYCKRYPGVFPGWPLAWLSVIGLAASLTHAYLLLATGMVWLFMLLSMPDRRLRIALLATGLAILTPNLLYFDWLMHATQLDLHHLWFKNSVGFFSKQIFHAVTQLLAKWTVAVLALLLLVGGLLRQFGRAALAWPRATLLAVPETRWTIGLCLCVLIGVTVCGIAVSILVAPSFSDRNLLTCAPFGWLLLAIAYDAIGPQRSSLWSNAAVVLLLLALGAQLLMIRGRSLPRNDPWRASSEYVAGLPGCNDQTLPVVLPFNFSPATAAFRTLTERDFFGYYLHGPQHLSAYLPGELAGPQALPEVTTLLDARSRAANTGSCPLLAWGVHDVDDQMALQLAQSMAQQQQHAVIVQTFGKFIWRRLSWVPRSAGYVLLLGPDATPGSPVGTITPTTAALSPQGRLLVGYSVNRISDHRTNLPAGGKASVAPAQPLP